MIKLKKYFLPLIVCAMLLSACGIPGQAFLTAAGASLHGGYSQEASVYIPLSNEHSQDDPRSPGWTDALSEDGLPPDVQPTGEVSKDGNEWINPLTGLPVSDPDLLKNPPALVSITNFPVTARPQAGLSFSPFVFEFFIGDGMTRFLAVFYGEYPRSAVPAMGGGSPEELAAGLPQPVIGPIRSGRLPYEHVRKLFNGFIVMASAYSRVADQLKDYVNVYGTDQSDPNSALMPVDKLADIARANRQELEMSALDVNTFDPAVPPGGKVAPSLWVFYAYLNQIFWRYDSQDGTYHRWQDNADASTFIEQTDRLNGTPLTYENVIVLFADHTVQNSYLIDVNLLYVKRGKALLLRDGQMFEIYWTTASEEYEKTTGKMRPIRFVDASGEPFPLKPGQTWVHIMPPYVPYWETVDSEVFNRLTAGRSKGSGFWAVYFKLDK